ncbi:catalase family peroxidase [Rhizobium calliandrae]|uniref:Catalase-related peroxidase n=2 Tax=Rhizobium calliandrae TaxID=1312182 RepID=A0ABT7KQ67_9HYPH|nr:catalase family peroxidase [Rhizobium calliandrae]MDL2410088.1 catalase family peroxidase [Rhizobium calliandrae]
MVHSQYRISTKLVEELHQVFGGFHPGYRDVHANGRYYAGTFRATPEAKNLSRAVHLQGDPVPVTVRHSNSRSGNPMGPATTASMAVRFYLPDGTTTDLVSLPISLFFARTPEETLGFLQAVRPDPATGQPDPDKVTLFLESRPWIAHAVQLAKGLSATVSFAQTAFHMLHAFRFVNEDGHATYARYHWEPEAGVAGQTLEELQKQPPSHLFDEYELRLQKAPVVFNLVLQLAGDGDKLDDPNAPWPDDRRRVHIGRLEITRPTTNEEIGDSVMMHDPTRLTDGIEPTDDPILAARRGIYEVSVAYRTGGWKGRQAALELGGCPFLGNAK